MSLPHTVLAVFINLLWGSMFIAASIGLEEFPPVLFTAVRFLLLVACLCMFLRVRRDQVKPLLVIGLLFGAGMYLTLYLSIALTNNVSSIAIFSKLEVPFAIILGIVILHEKVGIRRTIGILVAMVGAAFITFDPSAFDDLPALFWMAVSCAFSAYGMIKVRAFGDIHPLTITAWVSLVGGPVLLLISMGFESGQLDAVKNASLVGWSALVYTAIMSSVIAHSAFYYLLQRYPVSQVAPYSLLSPVFAVIGGILILGDRLTMPLVFGATLILSGVAWIQYRTRVREENG
jgi:O-acetylserine/cysteine efflux transporter